MFDSWLDAPRDSFSMQIYICRLSDQHWVRQGLPWFRHPTLQTLSNPYGSLCIASLHLYRCSSKCSKSWTYAPRSGHTSRTENIPIHSRRIIRAIFGNEHLFNVRSFIGLIVTRFYAWPLEPYFLAFAVAQLLSNAVKNSIHLIFALDLCGFNVGDEFIPW